MNKNKKELEVIILTLPILTGLLVFFAIPFFISVVYSFTSSGGSISFDNYTQVLNSIAFRLAAKNTIRFILIGVPLNIIFSFFIALLIKKFLMNFLFFRSILLFPLTVPVITLVMVVQIFFADNGIVNGWLLNANIPIQSWFNSDLAFYIALGLYLWKNCGYSVILFLSGLATISNELYEASDIDGVNSRQKLWYITLPNIAPMAFFVFVMAIVNTFKTYREIFILGGNQPHDSIYMLQHFLNNNFQNLNYQRISVASLLLFVCIAILVYLLLFFQKKYGES